MTDKEHKYTRYSKNCVNIALYIFSFKSEDWYQLFVTQNNQKWERNTSTIIQNYSDKLNLQNTSLCGVYVGGDMSILHLVSFKKIPSINYLNAKRSKIFSDRFSIRHRVIFLRTDPMPDFRNCIWFNNYTSSYSSFVNKIA